MSALGIGGLALAHGQTRPAAMAFGLAAACAGFLYWNLAQPAKIFLGDGGSMPVGFLVAAVGMTTSHAMHLGLPGFFAIALTAGVVVLDTTLVTVSRTRRGVPLLTGGRDHLSHRLLARLHTPRAVACALALAQASLCTLAITGDRLGKGPVLAFAAGSCVLGVGAIVILDSRRWRPADAAAATRSVSHQAPHVEASPADVT
jgi:UDP-GlcNAc:undecaprenyl-phosphate GlcNAc-1-phosphate transferase